MGTAEKYMTRCMELASMGRGMVAPNPMVGCVIVHQDRIIGEGYHHLYGGNHAEVEALLHVRDHALLPESTLYVNLEPCSHFGNTPPCTEAILKHGIRNIVIGCVDPNPKVAGKGISKLREAGCSVTTGVLETSCWWLNRRFMTFQTQKRPYIILKWAQTADGFIDIIREPDRENRPTWITGQEERYVVHKWRSEESGIMAGTRTIEADNPSLNIRFFTGSQPVRIIPDRHLKLTGSLNILDHTAPTLLVTEQKNSVSNPNKNINYLTVSSLDDLGEVLHALYRNNILSLFVEGGAQLLQSFLESGLWDEARIFTGLQEFGSGVPAPEIPAGLLREEYNFPGSRLSTYINQQSGLQRPKDTLYGTGSKPLPPQG